MRVRGDRYVYQYAILQYFLVSLLIYENLTFKVEGFFSAEIITTTLMSISLEACSLRHICMHQDRAEVSLKLTDFWKSQSLGSHWPCEHNNSS